MIYTRFECSFQRSIFDHDTDKKISETASDKEISETANSLFTLKTSEDVQLHSKRVKTSQTTLGTSEDSFELFIDFLRRSYILSL